MYLSFEFFYCYFNCAVWGMHWIVMGGFLTGSRIFASAAPYTWIFNFLNLYVRLFHLSVLIEIEWFGEVSLSSLWDRSSCNRIWTDLGFFLVCASALVGRNPFGKGERAQSYLARHLVFRWWFCVYSHWFCRAGHYFTGDKLTHW